MRFRYICPSTGHVIDTNFEIDCDDPIMLGTETIEMPCSFCGSSHNWSYVNALPFDEPNGKGFRS
jgi:hypothetical protein